MPRILTLLATLVALGACQEPGDAPSLSEIDGEFLAGSSSNYDYQVITGRYVTIYTGGTCTSNDMGWDRIPLFPGTASPRLQKFCIFQWDGVSSAKPLPTDLANLPTQASPDRFATSGMTTNALLEAATRNQIDPISAYHTTLPTTKARLTLVDTVPTSASPLDEEPFDEHGLKLATLADEAVCDDATPRQCAAEVETQLGIGWEASGTLGSLTFSKPTDGTDNIGGSIGRQSDVAASIVLAVDDWHAAHTATGSSVGELVLNLSLGWHPGADGDTSLSITEEAVYAALEYASCRDVLVLAAAGHRDTPTGELGETGAIYPAAWEAQAQPNGSRCSTQYGGVSRPTSTSGYRPLLYAVGAVTTDRKPIATTRPSSLPRLVAPGDFVTAGSNGSNGVPMDPITGTSAATALASATAAVMRTHRPLLSNHDIMRLLYLSGFSTPANSTVRLSGTSPKTIRVANVCRGLAKACAGEPCESWYLPSSCTGTAVPSVTFLPTSPVPDEELVSSGTESTVDCISGVSGHSFTYYGTALYGTTTTPEDNCPVQEIDSATAIAVVQPMPATTICLGCPTRFDPVGGPGWADLHTSEPLSDFNAVTLTVHFETDNGGVPDHYPLQGMITPGMTDLMLQLPDGSGERQVGPATHFATGVSLDYIDSQGFAYSEPLYLEN